MMERFQTPSNDNSANWRRGKNWEPEQEKSANNVRKNIGCLADALFNNEGFRRGHLLNRWFEILGENIGTNAYPRYVKNGVLFVTCSSPIWSQEITLQQMAIIERFNEVLPKEKHLQKIACKVGNIKMPVHETQRHLHLPQVTLDEEEQKRVAAVAAQTTDPEIGATVAKVYAQNLLRQKQLRKLGAIECSYCHHLSFTGSPCVECRRQYRAYERLYVLQILEECPWTKYQDLLAKLPHLEIGDFINYRLSLSSNWRENIRLYVRSLLEGLPKDTNPEEVPLPQDLQISMIRLVALDASKPYNELERGDVLHALHKKYGEALLNKRLPHITLPDIKIDRQK